MIRSDCSSTHRASPLDSLKDLDYCCREAKSSSVARIFGIRASNSLPPSQEPPSSTTRPLTSATAITAPIVNGVIMRNRKNSISTDGNTVTKETTTWVRGNTSRRMPLPSTGLRRCAARRRPRHAQMPGTDQIADNPCRQQYDHPCRSGKPCAIDHVKRNQERCRKQRPCHHIPNHGRNVAHSRPGRSLGTYAPMLRAAKRSTVQPLCSMGFHCTLEKMAWKEIGT